MRIELLIIFGVLIALLAVIFCIKVAKKLVGRIIVIIVAICVFMGGGSIINLNCLANEAKDKVQQVVSVVGDSYIKTEGSKIFINIDNTWYDVSKVRCRAGTGSCKGWILRLVIIKQTSN